MPDLIQGFIISSLTIAILLLCPLGFDHLKAITDDFIRNFEILRTTSLEQRKLQTYGDLTGIGYGYLRKIVDGIPEPSIFPVTRYRNYTQNAYLYFPGYRYKIDDRILIGIDLPPEDLIENYVAPARSVYQAVDSNSNRSMWAFVTVLDFDTLTGFQLHFDSPPPPDPQNISLTLFYSPSNQTALGRWSWNRISLQQSTFLKLSEALHQFSFSRGSLPFVIGIDIRPVQGRTSPGISQVDVIGIKVNLNGYTIIHREGQCFTALKNDFLTAIERNDLQDWQKYLGRIKNV
ncbi:MAG: hypothetical protein NC930_00115 [Candidatus Omnitrophica bacterium]|nr:hypothetical protein [Candidatus Omnitrophota bacterium]